MNQKTKLIISIGLNISLIITLITILIGIFGTTAFDFFLFKKTLPTICTESQKNGTELRAINPDGTTADICQF